MIYTLKTKYWINKVLYFVVKLLNFVAYFLYVILTIGHRLSQ